MKMVGKEGGEKQGYRVQGWVSSDMRGREGGERGEPAQGERMFL